MAASTISVRLIIDSAHKILQDETHTRWPLDELLRWYNEAQRQIVLLRPDACAVTEPLRLVAGSQQRIPNGGLRMLDVIHNLGIDGSSPGDVITLCERNILDTQIRGWHYRNPSATVLHWVYDDRIPDIFWTYPPQPGVGQGTALIQYSKTPTPATLKNVSDEQGVVGSQDSIISISDVYQPALVDLTVYRCMCKQQTYVQQGIDVAYWSRAMQSLGLKTEVDRAFTPRKNAPPATNRNVPSNTGAFGDE